jgi:hypothetical protein
VAIGPEQALEVLQQLAAQLGEVASGTRAIVGLRDDGDGNAALVDVTLRDDGVLELPDDPVDGLVVVTDEEVAADGEVVALHELLCVLPDGVEVGIYRIAGEEPLRAWRTDADENDEAEALRPRDVASNTARRAFGLPSLVDDPPPVSELLARVWLLDVAREAMARFDQPDGPREVTPEELAEVAEEAGGSVLGEVDHDPVPTWTQLHDAAAAGRLELGPFGVEPTHAAWLDAPGFAQVLDRTLPPVEELLGSLRVVGEDDLLAWAIGWLSARDWYHAA